MKQYNIVFPIFVSLFLETMHLCQSFQQQPLKSNFSIVGRSYSPKSTHGIYFDSTLMTKRSSNDVLSIHQMSRQPQNNDSKQQTKETTNPPPTTTTTEVKSTINITSFTINTLSILGLSSAFILFWSEFSVLLTKCSPVTLPVNIERSAYLSSFLFAAGTNLSKIIFGCSMTELLFQDDYDDDDYYYHRTKNVFLNNDIDINENINNNSNRNTETTKIQQIEIGLFYATEVVAFMAVVSAFGVVFWQIAQGVEMPGSDERWCRLINE